MTRLELIAQLEQRRNTATEERTRAYKARQREAFMQAFGRIDEIDAILLILKTNLINGD